MSSVASPPSEQQRGRFRQPHDPEITARLRKATGQLARITGMYEDRRYCIEILDQLAAVSAAIDAVALLLLTDHVNACVRQAITDDEPDEKIAELLTAVRRYVRSR